MQNFQIFKNLKTNIIIEFTFEEQKGHFVWQLHTFLNQYLPNIKVNKISSNTFNCILAVKIAYKLGYLNTEEAMTSNVIERITPDEFNSFLGQNDLLI